MSSGKALAIKRINKDIKEINKSPIEGIGIASIDNDPMKYVVNIRLMMGIYEGYCLQLLLTFSDNYPTKPPKILIFPDQAISNEYHHHIFPDSLKDENGHYFKKFCFDLLDNDFMNINEEHTGWNPSYSISSLLLQVQNFISDPDLPINHLPNNSKIEELMKSMDNYKRKFIIEDENGKSEIIHEWKNPYPKMYSKKIKKEEKNEIKSENNDKNLQIIKDNLTCFMLKLNYIDDPEILLGYPILQKKGLGKDKIELYPIPELLTYEGFMAQIDKQDSKLDYYFNTKFKSANNEYYNYWVPIYIDKNHYLKNRTAILNSFSIIKYGPRGIKEYDFKPEQIIEILPIILNKMIIGMFNGQSSISSAFIRCYFHYVLLFKKLSIEFKNEFITYLNHKLNLIHKNHYNANKHIIPDIGDFLVSLFFCDGNTKNEKMEKMWFCLFEEFVTRQIFWMLYNGGEIENIFDEIKIEFEKEEDKNEYINQIKLIKENTYKEYIKNGSCFINIDDNNAFIEDLKNEKLYEKIIDAFIPGIYDKKYLRKEKQNKINENFSQEFNKSPLFIKKEIINILVTKNEDYYDYFELSENGEKQYESKTDILINRFNEKIKKSKGYNQIIYNLLFSDKNKNLLEKFVENAYKSQRGNNLLLITFFAQKKIEEEGSIEKLEKNYGIYLEVDNFIKEMKQKLEEVKSYNQLFKYVGSEFGKNKTDVEIIRIAYRKAKYKRYVGRTPNFSANKNKDENNIRRDFRGRGRVRGRGRGRGR